MQSFLYISTLGSGSSGNSLIISNGASALMVDVGFSCKETKNRLSRLLPAPAPLAAALITHDHSDHVKGCRVFCDEKQIPAAVSIRTAEYLRPRDMLPCRYFEFEPGSEFEVANFRVRSFPVSHDATEPVGFVICSGAFSVGIATDLGELDQNASRHLQDCDALILESNYDPCLLRDCDRPLRLKRRIAGRHGHLENGALCNALPQLISERTKLLMLVHISSECNDHELALRMAREKLAEMGRSDIVLSAARQDQISGPFKLES